MHTIRSRPPTYFTGGAADGKQTLLGWISDFVAVVFFHQNGTLLESRKYPLGTDLSKGLGPDVEAKVTAEIRTVMDWIGFCEGPIQVQPFFIEEWQLGIEQFPEDLADFLANPNSFPEEDAEICRSDIEKWKVAGNSVLKWGNDYHLDHEGYTL